jgi:RNA polymerase sigma factor (sigma-70 family)
MSPLPLLSTLLLRSQSDERLAAMARAGHEQAFATLVQRYRRPLSAYAQRLVGESRSDDVVQDVFVRAFIALQRGDRVEHVRAWLFTVAHNSAVNALRDRARETAPLSAELPGDDGPHATVERRVRAENSLHAVARLPERQRDAVVLTAVQGRSGAEAAAMLGVSDSAMYQLLYRARGTLRKAVTAVTPLPLAMAASGSGAPIAAHVAEAGGGAGLGIAKVVAACTVVAAAAGGALHIDSGSQRHPTVGPDVAQAAPPTQHRNAVRAADTRTPSASLPVATAAPVRETTNVAGGPHAPGHASDERAPGDSEHAAEPNRSAKPGSDSSAPEAEHKAPEPERSRPDAPRKPAEVDPAPPDRAPLEAAKTPAEPDPAARTAPHDE